MITVGHLQYIYSVVEEMQELPAQDHDLVLEMSQAMLSDVIETGHLKPLSEYTGRYVDMADSKYELDHITAELNQKALEAAL